MNAFLMKRLPLAAITASSTAPGYAANAVANDYAGVVWKSAGGATTATLVIDLGSAKSIDTVLLFGCTDAQAGWTLKVEGAANSAISTSVWDGGTVTMLAGSEMPSHGRGVGFWTSPTLSPARRYWRLTFGALANAPVTVAIAALGARIQLERNFSFGAGFGLRDLGSVDFSSQGVLLRRRGAKLRTVGLSFSSVRKDEVEAKVQPLLEQVGAQEPIVLVTDPEPHPQRQSRCYFGPLFGDLGTVWRNASAWEWRANLTDLIPIPRSA